MPGEVPNEPEDFVKDLSQTFARRFGGTPEDNETLAIWVETGIADALIKGKSLRAVSQLDEYGMHTVVTLKLVETADGSVEWENRSTYLTSQEVALMLSIDKAKSLLPPSILPSWQSVDKPEPPDKLS